MTDRERLLNRLLAADDKTLDALMIALPEMRDLFEMLQELRKK